MLNHLFVSSGNGNLYDTRNAAWSRLPPLRRGFKYTYAQIHNAAQYKATLRNGAYAWPGGYPLYFVASDGEALCFACARKEARNVLQSILDQCDDGWRVIGCDVNYEDPDLCCAHCSKPVESAYGAD
jgi:hypothetical protein